MRALLWLLAVFSAAVLIAVAGRVNDGYALFVYPPYRIELSLVFFAVSLLAVFALLYAGFRVVHHIIRLPVHVREYRERKRKAQAHASLLGALQAHFEGRYSRAERDARLAYEAGESRALAALLAARSANSLQARDRREAWLQRAAEVNGDPLHVARLVTQAELLLEDRDFANARSILQELHGSGPRHIASLRMLLRAELGTRNWEEVLRLSALLAKRDALSPARHEEYKSQALVELLSVVSGDASAFESRWNSIAPKDRSVSKVALAGARIANGLRLYELSRQIVETALAAEWSTSLVDLYGTASGNEVRRRIEHAERWLLDRPQDARLLLALGRLCLAAELWGKAQSYIEASLAFDGGRDGHVELARLFDRLGRVADADRHYRAAAESGLLASQSLGTRNTS